MTCGLLTGYPACSPTWKRKTLPLLPRPPRRRRCRRLHPTAPTVTTRRRPNKRANFPFPLSLAFRQIDGRGAVFAAFTKGFAKCLKSGLQHHTPFFMIPPTIDDWVRQKDGSPREDIFGSGHGDSRDFPFSFSFFFPFFYWLFPASRALHPCVHSAVMRFSSKISTTVFLF